MKHLTLLGSALALFASAGCFAQDAAAAKPARALSPSYRWVEASYGVEYFGADDVRVRADRAWRLSGSYKIVPHLYVLGSYNTADYIDVFSIDSISAGLGTYVSLAPSLHGILNVTYEKFDVTDDSSSPPSKLKEDGIGFEAGVRYLTAYRAELDASYKYTQLEGDDSFGSSYKDKSGGFNLGMIVPLNPSTSVSLRIENIGVKDDAEAAFADADFENYLLGVRYRF